MKKLLVLGIVIITILTLLLSGCSGTPKAPVGKLLDLDELVTEHMTLDQVYALLKPELKDTSVLYQAQNIELTENGNWKVVSKQDGFAAGEEGPYQVLFFTPAKAGADYFLVFFQNKAVMAKVWFASQHAVLIKNILLGD
jgi:hypothetical protein